MEAIKLSAKLFNAARLFCSTEETRYYLGGVQVQPHPEAGVTLAATDGHRLLIIHDAAGIADRTIILSAEKEMVRALDRAKEDAVISVAGDGIVTIPGYYQSAKSLLIDGTYPDWTRVVDPVRKAIAEKKIGLCSFNVGYLASFEKVAVRLSPVKSDTLAIRIVSTDEGDPALVLFPAFPHAFGLLMPMRQPVEHGLPAWMKSVLQPKPEVSIAPTKKARPKPSARRKPALKKRVRAKAKMPAAAKAKKTKRRRAA